MALYNDNYIPSDTRFVKISETELYAIKWPAIKPKQIRKIVPIDGEIWRPIPETEGLFYISNLGRIKSSRRMKNGRLIEKHVEGTSSCKNKQRVRLVVGNKLLTDYTCRIVMKVFDPIPDAPKKVVIYLDGDITNNKLENLQWGTKKQAREWIKANGEEVPWLKTRERVHPITGKVTIWKTRFSDSDVTHMIRLYKSNISPQKIAQIFDCSQPQVIKFCKGELRPELLQQFNAILERETTKKTRKVKKGKDELS
jgi:hypothetical protein